MSRPAPSIAFGVTGLLAVAISLGFAIWNAGQSESAPPKRFSGSNIVSAMPSLLAPLRMPAPLSVAIVRDQEAANFYDSAAEFDEIVQLWRWKMVAAGAKVSVLRPAQLRSTRADVIVVPSSPCLSVDTREAIDNAGARGQGLVVTGRVGTHDGGCRQLAGGYGLLIALTGASRAEPLKGRPMVYVTLPGDGPLAANIPPGSRINLGPAGQIALRVPTRDAFYSTYTLGARPADDSPYLDGAIVRSEYRGARVVYFGFELSEVAHSEWHDGVLGLLVRNAAAWAGGLPLASVASWPAKHRSAAVIAQDVENRFDNARHAVDSLTAIGVRSTFFVTTNLVPEHRKLTERMSAVGELATHSENHALLGGTPYLKQRERLEITRRALRELMDVNVRGLRPPEEQFDRATMAAWVDAGGVYLLGTNDARCAAPELLSVGRDTLVLIPRVFSDDFAATAPGGGRMRPPKAMQTLFSGEMRKAHDIGGLFVLSYHSQLLSRREYVPVLASVTRQLAADSTVWLAPAGDVADWWRRRAWLDVRASRVSSQQLDVTVRNRGDEAVDSVTVNVSLPRGRDLLSASVPASERDGQAVLSVGRVPANGVRRVRVQMR